MQLTFEIDWNQIKTGHLLADLNRAEKKITKLNNQLRAYRGWKTKRNKNKFASK